MWCSWWWVKDPPETCRAVYRNKKLCNIASCWSYFGIHLRCTDPWTSNLYSLSSDNRELQIWKKLQKITFLSTHRNTDRYDNPINSSFAIKYREYGVGGNNDVTCDWLSFEMPQGYGETGESYGTISSQAQHTHLHIKQQLSSVYRIRQLRKFAAVPTKLFFPTFHCETLGFTRKLNGSTDHQHALITNEMWWNMITSIKYHIKSNRRRWTME